MFRLATAAVAATVLRCGCSEPTLMIVANASDTSEAAIADGGSIERTLSVNTAGRIVRATVEAIVEHPNPDELEVVLISPANTSLTIGGRLADGCDFYRYAIPLLALQGEEATGTWRLRVTDGRAGNSGRIVTWGLSFEALE